MARNMIRITDPVIDPHEPESFYVDVEIMHGDADSFEHLEIGPFRFSDDDDLLGLLDLLDRMKSAFPNGRGGGTRDNYDNVEGFAEWFLGEFDEKSNEYVAEPIFWQYDAGSVEFWPVDGYDYETHGDPWKYHVYYYDTNKTKFNTVGAKQNG